MNKHSKCPLCGNLPETAWHEETETTYKKWVTGCFRCGLFSRPALQENMSHQEWEELVSKFPEFGKEANDGRGLD